VFVDFLLLWTSNKLNCIQNTCVLMLLQLVSISFSLWKVLSVSSKANLLAAHSIFVYQCVYYSPSLFKILFLSYCCSGDTLWHLQKCLQYILVKFTPSIMLLESGTRQQFLSTLIQYSAWISSQSNKARLWNKRGVSRKGWSHITPICRWHDPILQWP
jgi:hypothetical protein